MSEEIKTSEVDPCVFCEMVRKQQINIGVVFSVFLSHRKLKICASHKAKLAEGVDAISSQIREEIHKAITG